MGYKFLEGLSLADVAFEADGKTLEGLLESAALATTNVMVRDLKKINPKEKVLIKVAGKDEETLLFNFLQEIIYLKDAKRLIFGRFKTKTRKKGNAYSLSCIAYGEKLDMAKHELVVDVKAVTYHLFEVKKENGKWKSRVILDI